MEWFRVCDELAAAGRLELADRAILTIYCSTWAAHRAASREVTKTGTVIEFPNKAIGPSPFYKVMKETAAQLRALLADLGLTPATRGSAKQPDTEDLEV